jgi:hypothetical protein
MEGFPIVSVIDADIVKAIGWIQYPELIHSCGDNVWYWIARRTKRLEIRRNVYYVHKSAYFGDGEDDETFKRTNVRDSLMDDYYRYRDWLKYKINDDLDKLKELECVMK